ncbi:MAG: peptidoglycan DD-metalloendopeptidase family protein [Cyanobacteria bacterium P01_G01_bin.54]
MSQTRHPSFGLLRSSLLTKSLGVLSGLGLLSSGLAWSQTDVFVDNLGSTAPSTSAPAPAPAAPQLNKAPKPAAATAPQTVAVPQTTAVPQPSAAPVPTQPLPAPTVAVPPQSSPSPSVPEARPTVADQSPVPSPAQPPRQTQVYIDQTPYGAPATQPSLLPQVVVSDRASSCKTIVHQGRLTQGRCQTTQASTTPASRPRSAAPPRVAIPSALNQPPRPLARRGVPPLEPRNGSKSRGLRRIVPQNFKLPTLVNRALQRPAPYPNNGNQGLLFPLGLPADVSSVFGWRLHPISGDWRMHTGTDLAAPQGTPVLATYHGEVVMAEPVGGYGNMVVMRHEDGSQESRYAHLSHIFVQPGEWVEQGDVIGLVGSTGNSTGPHLHFEWRHWVADSWVPVDAGPQLQWALAEMRQAMLRTLPLEQQEQLVAELALEPTPQLGQMALGSGLLFFESTTEKIIDLGNIDPDLDSGTSVATPLSRSVAPAVTAQPEVVPTVESAQASFKPQPLYRLEKSKPNQPLKAVPSKALQNPRLQP